MTSATAPPVARPQLTLTFQVSVYLLAAVSAVILACAEGSPLAAGTLPLALLAFYLTERRQVILLPQWVASILGVLAFALAASELFGESIEARLLSGAHLLVYLTWIVLFQDKGIRQFWLMLALSLLQVAVSSVLTASGLFGIALVAYLFLGLWTMSAFSLYRAQQRLIDLETGSRTAGRTAEGFALLHASSEASAVIQKEPQQRRLGLRFGLDTAGMTSLSLLVAGFFFLLVPRQWIGGDTWGRDRPLDGAALTGFTETVQLGDFGSILGSTRKVMEVRAFDEITGREKSVETLAVQYGMDEPLFRGKVLDTYRSGRWSAFPHRMADGGRPYQMSNTRTIGIPLATIRQEVRLEAIGTQLLFSMHPSPIRGVYGGRVRGRRLPLREHQLTKVLARHLRVRRGSISYEVFSRRPRVPPPRGRQSDELPRVLEYCRRLPASGLSNLTATARRLAGFDEPIRPPQGEMSRRLVVWLRDAGGFEYTLNLDRPTRGVDPVEDFLQRKRGHCEYFASALALMLRAVGIPSRLVSGFKGGETNSYSGVFEVQERHAHAWVEAYLDGEWRTLDATPAGRADLVAAITPRLRSWRDFLAMAEGLWIRYVIDVSLTQQDREFYRPLESTAREWWSAATGTGGGAASILSSIWETFTSPDLLFSGRGLLVVAVLLIVVCAGVWITRRVVRLLGTLGESLAGDVHRRRKSIAFYERFLTVCERLGLRRLPSQTQREFAGSVAGRLQAQLAEASLEQLPGELTEAYYEARFGDRSPSSERVATLDSGLTRLEAALSKA